jgi:protein-disulfide isomerase
VEFLDFECEACRAAYPMVEQLRKDYAGKVTFVARYFPLQGHFNGERAARAVEAAAEQGKYEAMYQKMFDTQTEWGEQQVPADDTFRGFAKELGLDVAAWEKAYNDPATLKRIKKDVADGASLGVQGTPSFFLNGKKLEPQSFEDFKAAIDAALAE